MVYSKDCPYSALLKTKQLLSKTGSTKRCHHIELIIDPQEISFIPGDSIGIIPENSPEIVRKILSSLKVKEDTPIFSSRYKKEYSIQQFLLKKANLNKITSSLFLFLLQKCTDQKKKSFEPFFPAEKKSELSQLLATYELWDLLVELSPQDIPLQEFSDKLLPQMPRFYSIASSHKIHPGEIHLTVDEIFYSTRGHQRHGVASHFLTKLALERKTPIPMYIQPSHGFTLPLDPASKVLMIGPGTGIAPFRAFMQERLFEKATGANWLFFGERNRSSDFYYQNFWEDLERKKFLRLSTAFSRDQPQKYYVQHLLKEHAKEIWDWIQNGAHLYVCGDASQMARDVDFTLQEIVKTQAPMSEEDAIQFLKALKAQKRYLLDVY